MNIQFLHISKLINWFSVFVITAGLSLILIWFGIFKFTMTEAKGIKGLVENSPLMSWMYNIFSVTTVSHIIGVMEIVAGTGMLVGLAFPKLGLAGSLLSTLIFFVTCSFMLSSGGVLEKIEGLWIPSDLGGFLIKDIAALGGSSFLVAHYIKILGQ